MPRNPDQDVIDWVTSHPDVPPNSMERAMARIEKGLVVWFAVLLLLAWAGVIH